ncbi:hypothetical protein A8B83_11035 [Rhodobacteraceae bacterium EhC02]|nr:hypothetical protein A8B83_11035 [Rhodobacteraceae bacterium EhC02]
MARWIGFAIIAHPSVSENVAVPKVVIDQSDQEIAELLTQLMTDRCRAQSIASLAESDASFENAFEVLGAVAMEELMRDKAVEARITAFAALIDESRFSGMD